MSDKFKVVREPGEKFRVETPDRKSVIGTIKTVPNHTHKYQLTSYPKHTLYTKFLHLPTAIHHIIESHTSGPAQSKKWNWFKKKPKPQTTDAPEYTHIKQNGDPDEHDSHENIDKTKGHTYAPHEDPVEHIHAAAGELRHKIWGAASHGSTNQESLLQVSKAHAAFQKQLDQHMPKK